MDLEKLSPIVKKLVTKTGSVRGAVLVSNEAELITDPIGEWDEVFITKLAEHILDFTDKTNEDLGWSFLEQIWLQTEENHFIGIYCNEVVFLLVKASNNARLGSLRNATNDAVKALKTALDTEVIPNGEKISPDSYNGEPPNPEAMEGEEEVIWRGNKLQS